MMQDESETINDIAEMTIIDRIKRGDENNARWWLARTRRAKFGDSVDITSGGQAIKIDVEWRTIDVGQSETTSAAPEAGGDSI